MPKTVIWSPLSQRDLNQILDYLDANWGKSVALNYLEIINLLIYELTLHPKQFPLINKKKNIRKCVITKHNSLYYTISKNKIAILRIFDTRQDPSKLTY